MKKITLLLISLLTASVCYAQGGYYDSWDKNYLNLGFVETTMSQDGRIDLKSNYGSSFTIGRTFFYKTNKENKELINILYYNRDRERADYWFVFEKIN